MNKDALDLYTRVFDSINSPLLLVGETGVGKSEVVKQYAEKRGYLFFNIRLSEYELSDLTGLPKKNKNFVEFLPPKFVYEASKERSLVFFDELNRASLEVRQLVFRATDSLYFGTTPLHPETKIMGAINPTNEKYYVETLEYAELSRWAILDFSPPPDAWFYYILHNKRKYNPLIFSFLEHNPQYLDGVEIVRSGLRSQTNRRQWTRLSEDLFRRGNANIIGDLLSGRDDYVQSTIKAYVGEEIREQIELFYYDWVKTEEYNPVHYSPERVEHLYHMLEWAKINVSLLKKSNFLWKYLILNPKINCFWDQEKFTKPTLEYYAAVKEFLAKEVGIIGPEIDSEIEREVEVEDIF